jgi:hypothetical protein
MNLDHLFRPDGPCLHRLVASESDLCDTAWSLERPARSVSRVVRGAKSPAAPELFDEIAAALQFPYYFGENWDALADCLADLGWLTADAVVIFISNAARLLDGEAPEELHTFLDVVQMAARNPIEGPNDRRRILRVVLHTTPEDEPLLAQRLQAAGIAWDDVA